MQRQPLLLASQSPTRAALLAGAGLCFETRNPRLDEAAVKAAGRSAGTPPETVALQLAELKARQISCTDALVIGADQLLVCNGRWFDKPPTIYAARDQLLALRGQTHELVTAITCIHNGALLWHHVARPRLTMRPFSDAFLEAYLALENDHLLQSVGAYRLEGPGAQLFDTVEGEFAAILGLPLLPLLAFLRQTGALLG